MSKAKNYPSKSTVLTKIKSDDKLTLEALFKKIKRKAQQLAKAGLFPPETVESFNRIFNTVYQGYLEYSGKESKTVILELTTQLREVEQYFDAIFVDYDLLKEELEAQEMRVD